MREISIGISYTEDGYLLNQYKNHKIINTQRIQNPNIIRELMAGIEYEAKSISFTKNYKDLLIYMNTPNKEQKKIIIEDYDKSIESPLISSIVQNVYEQTQSSEIVEIHPASEKLQLLLKKMVLTGTLIGVGTFLVGSLVKLQTKDLHPEIAVVTPMPITTEQQPVEKTEMEKKIETELVTMVEQPPIEEKLLYNQPLMDVEIREHIQKIAEEYEIPFQIMMTIAHVESGGNFNNNGLISKSDDYGYMQINKVNLEVLCEELDITVDEILNDPYVNIEASAYLLKNICNICEEKHGKLINREVYGMYNGWINWDEKPISRNYVEKAEVAEQEFYREDQMVPISELTGMKIQ